MVGHEKHENHKKRKSLATDRTDGHGLGLMIVDDLCQRYGWQFKIGTHPEGGCEAVIDLASEHQE